jgi:hypothetical protein
LSVDRVQRRLRRHSSPLAGRTGIRRSWDPQDRFVDGLQRRSGGRVRISGVRWIRPQQLVLDGYPPGMQDGEATWHSILLGDHDHAYFSSSSSVAPCAAPFLARRRRTCRRRPDRPRRRRGRGRRLFRAGLTRFRAEQRPHLVEWPDPRDGHGNDQLRWQLGEFPRRKLHVLRQQRRRSCRHLPGSEQRLGCHAGRERPEQRADDRP